MKTLMFVAALLLTASALATTHSEVRGPQNGPTVVLVHGVSGPMMVWDAAMEPLVDAGFRVIRYDLYGRGGSTRLSDARQYTLTTYVKQLEDLLTAVGATEPVQIVGSSFGAIVSTEFTLQHPDRVRSVVLIGPAGFPIRVPPLARVGNLPWVGDWFAKLFGRKVILEQNRKYFVDEKGPPGFLEAFEKQLAIPGSVEAIRATMKYAPVQNFVASYTQLGKLRLPVGVIWGRKDVTFPYANHSTLQASIPHAELVTIENAGHLPQIERPAESVPALVRLLSEGKPHTAR